ncbi:MAG TPA: beta-1,3-glucanase family protein [Candidatus Rubrimentiphilum sp.]|nr:beta-1,3-glucanase family protein [Candidatus Rubrimentiphilum sp.]
MVAVVRRYAPRFLGFAYCGLLLAAFATACSHSGGSGLPPGASSPGLLTPQSVSPGSIKPAPMVHTEILPASAMTSPVHPNIPVTSLNWSQIPGTATAVAAAPDGSFWALSDQPAGSDKYIWHYANGTWTNISGQASAIAVASDNSLWAINAEGGIYHYTSGTWTPLGGSAGGSITADSSGGIYVLTNTGAGSDRAIWYYTSGGGWVQQAGSGTALAANLDTKTYTPGAGGSGTIKPGGFYILNSVGAVWYENSDQSFAQLPGSASAIAPTAKGGVFVLGYPAGSSGSAVYYYDLDNPGWTSESGSGLNSMSANTSLYLTSSSNAIYSATLPQNLPAYCAAYANPSPNPSGATIYITDDSGLNVPLIVYVVRKPGKQNPAPIAWLDANQNFTSSVPVPLPAACFSTTLNSSSTVKFVTPDGMDGGRWYFVYATPVPGHPEQVPNPMASALDAGPGFSYASAPYPYDFVEGGTTNDSALIIDTTQVDALGLPMDLSTQPASAPLPIRPACGSTTLVVGVSSCNFANIFRDMNADPVYGKLVIAQPFNGTNYDLRILNPQQAAGVSAFEWNVLGDASALPAPLPSPCTGPTTYGYLSCVMSSYKTTPRMYSSNRTVVAGAIGSGDIYCVSSDDNSNFIMTDVGPGPGSAAPVPSSPPMCNAGYTPAPNRPGAPVNPFKMPVQEFLYGIPPANDGGGGCKLALLLSQPWGLANVDNNGIAGVPQDGHIFHTNDAFALWKAMNAEFVYGTALSTQEHPVGYFYSSTGNTFMPPSFSPLFADPMFDTYAVILHKYFDNNRAYALAFDDFFDFATTLHYNYSHAISVRINPLPVAVATSSPNPVASPVPNPCPAIPANVGGF